MKLIINLLLLFVIYNVNAQQASTGKVKGKVMDENNKPVIGATVSLHQLPDSILLKSKFSDQTGDFEIAGIKEGQFYLSVSHTGYSKNISAPFSLTLASPVFTMASISLKISAAQLNTVSVTSRRPLIEQKIDRMVVNVEGTITATGSNLLDVIEKSPGITVDQNGNISMSGKSGVLIYIDDKPTILSGQDLVIMLRSMNSSQVDRLELMTNPPAKYDASGNAGIINIRMKKDQRMGTNGTINFMSGIGVYKSKVYYNFSPGISFNYRNKKINLYGTTNYNHIFIKSQFSEKRYFERGEPSETILKLDGGITFKAQPVSQRLGLDYFVNKKTTIGFLVNGVTNHFYPTGLNTAFIQNNGSIAINKTTTLNNSDDLWQNVSFNSNIKHAFDSSGKEFSADIDYAHYSRETSQVFTTDFFDAMGNSGAPSFILRGDLAGRLYLYSFKFDFTLPVKKKYVLSFGAKSSFVKNNNRITFYNKTGTGPEKYDSTRSNHFLYDENINALYVNFQKQINKWQLQLGLRTEQTNANGNQVTSGVKFIRNYWQLFPTVFISYKMSPKNEFTFSVGRRIDRPAYGQLNPFVVFTTPQSYSTGNPFLKPQITNNFEARHIFAGKYVTGISYSKTSDAIFGIIRQTDSSRTYYNTPDNVATLYRAGISFNAPVTITKWFTTNINVNAFYNQVKGAFFSEVLNMSRVSFNGNLTNNFQLSKSIRAEMNFVYQRPAIQGFTIMDDYWFMGAGLQKTILKNKGTLRLNVTDIFFTNKRYFTTDFANQFAQATNRGLLSRTYTLNFSYRFGKNTVQGERRRGTGADEERSRAN